MSPIQRPMRHSVVCEAAPKKKADSAAKRARQAEKRRIYNKSRKSEIRTRMRKVCKLLGTYFVIDVICLYHSLLIYNMDSFPS